MLDNDTPPIGHNNPPPYNEDELANLAKGAADFIAASQVWMKETIEDDDQAGLLADQISGLRGQFKKVDEARKAAKKPHDEAGAKVQAAFTPILTKLTRAAEALKPLLAKYVERKAQIEAEEKRQAEAKARREREIAEQKLREAEAEGNIDAAVDAEAELTKAQKQEKAAAKPVSTQVKSSSGGGRTMAARSTWKAKITNIRQLFLHYQEHPDVIEVLQRLADADMRAAKGENPDIPGAEPLEVKSIA